MMMLFILKLACINRSLKRSNFRGHPPACVRSRSRQIAPSLHRLLARSRGNQPDGGAHIDLHLPRISIGVVNWCKLRLARTLGLWPNWHELESSGVAEWIIQNNLPWGRKRQSGNPPLIHSYKTSCSLRQWESSLVLSIPLQPRRLIASNHLGELLS